jgi:integration host factor subunit alpha
MVLTKLDLTKKLIKAIPSMERNDAILLVEQFFEEIRLALENGEDVKLAGFGNFELRDKKQRPGRNPRTGEVIPVSARRVVTFHPSQKLKEKIYENNEQQK